MVMELVLHAVVVYRCVPSANFSSCQSNGPATANGCVCHDVAPALWKSHSNGLTRDAVLCPLCTQLKGHYLHASQVDAKVRVRATVSVTVKAHMNSQCAGINVIIVVIMPSVL